MESPEEIHEVDEWYQSNDSFFEQHFTDSNSFILTSQVVLYCLLFLVGVPGNAYVLVLFAKRQGNSLFNLSSSLLIVSLTVANLGIILVYVPFYIAYEAMGLIWPFGEGMCKFVFSFTHLCVYASLGTMIGVAIERYQVTFDMLVSKVAIRVGLLVVWVLALVLCIPQIVNLQLVSFDEEIHADTEYVCELIWPDPIYEKVLHPMDFMLCYLFPLALISGLYVKIGAMLRSAIRRQVPNHRLAKQAQNVVFALVVVVLVFGICNLPIHLFHLVRIFYFEKWLSITEQSPWVFSLCAALYLLPHVVNPLIYAALNQKFRHELGTTLKKCRPACHCIIVPWNCFRRIFQRISRKDAKEQSLDRVLELIQLSDGDRV